MRSEVVPQTGGPRQVQSAAPARRVRAGMALACAAALACAGSTRAQITIGPPPSKDTHAVLAGPLCQDNHCRCRSEGGDGGVGIPETNDRKRFELRLASAYDLWVTINQTTVLYKSPERADACFYIDLPPGAHQVELRASN